MASGLARVRGIASLVALGGNACYAAGAFALAVWVAFRVDSISIVTRWFGSAALVCFAGTGVCGAIAAWRRYGYWSRDPKELTERPSSWIDEDLRLAEPWLKRRLILHGVGILLLLGGAATGLLWPPSNLRR
jgi:hypothetical protein